jgi:nitrite reductase/ring-hydroxylating ferredoxin subunit
LGFSPLCTLEEIPVGSALRFAVGGHEIALFHCETGLIAIDDVCTHARALLSEGSFDHLRCTVECPLHGAEFDLCSGAPLTPPATAPAVSYPVRVREGMVEVDVGEPAAGEE